MKFNIMDQSGHSEETFGSDKLSTEQAMARFAELTGTKKMRAAVPTGDGTHDLIKTFDPDAEQVVFIPPLVGG
jgi:hypothetical protein